MEYNNTCINSCNEEYLSDYKSYDDSLLINLNYWSYKNNFNELVEYVLNLDSSRYTKKMFDSLKLLLVNLYKNFINGGLYTCYHRSTTGTYGKSRYNKHKIGRKIINKMVDLLIALNLIEHKKGFYSRNEYSKGIGKISRMRANSSLINLMENQFNINSSMICRLQDEEVIHLKDSAKILIGYDDNKRTNVMRNKIVKYNQLLLDTDISINWKYVDPADCKVDLFSRKVHRVFNNSSWTLGGRYYGAFWMHVSKSVRNHIHINSNPTVELDYAGLHINMLYALEGINYDHSKDVYDLPDYQIGNNRKLRAIVKRLLLIAINCDTRAKALGALREELYEKPEDYPESKNLPDLNKLLDDFADHHKPIANYLYSGMGLKLQYLDSLITEIIIKEMTSRGIPILSIHDSYICEKEHVLVLRNLMNQAYVKILGKEFPDVKPPNIELIETDPEMEFSVNEKKKIFNKFAFTSVKSGKYKGFSLPHLFFIDSDYFCWAVNQKGFFKKQQKKESLELLRRAASIRIPQGDGWVAEYQTNPATRKFEALRVVPNAKVSSGAEHKIHMSTIDLTVPSKISSYDKEGNRKMLSQVKEILFGDKDFDLTKELCEKFFNNPDNFLLESDQENYGKAA